MKRISKKPIIKCEICGIDILKRNETTKFCSKNCQNQWQRTVKWEDRVGDDVAARIRQETSKRVSGDKNPTCKPEIAKKVSESLKAYLIDNPRIGEKNHFYGKTHTDEIKKHWSETKKGKWAYTKESYQKQNTNTLKRENHPNWQGGISNDDYDFDFNKELKKQIKEKFDYHCCLCNKDTQKLAIHHIDYDKMNSEIENLVPLCISCHSKTNYKRDLWKMFFKKLLELKI